MKKLSTGREMMIIARRELKSYFVSPVAYIVLGIFVVFNAIFFFSTFFIYDRAEISSLFIRTVSIFGVVRIPIMALFLSLAVPAITMRVFAEEKKSGTFEILITIPLRTFSIVSGKILAVFVFTAVMIASTLFFPISLSAVAKFDIGPILGGYLGTFLLALAFSAIGVFTSASTKNQIVAFVIALIINVFLCLIHLFFIFLPASIIDLFQYISIYYHFDMISKGLFDIRNLIYFISLIVLFTAGTIRMVEERR